jgi:translocation and assembly module TamB
VTRLRRRLVVPVTLALGLAMALAGGGAALLWTTWGLRALVAAGGGLVAAGRVDGSLADGAVFEALRIDAGGLGIASPRLALALSPSALLAGEIRIARLDAATLIVSGGGNADSAPGGLPVAPRLPFGLVVEAAEVAALRFEPGGDEPAVEVGRIAAALRWPRGGALELTKLTLDRGPLALDASLRWDTALAGRLDWRHAPEGAPVLEGAGDFRGQGAQVSLRQRLSAPLAASLDGELTLGGAAPTWRARLATDGAQSLPPSLAAGHALTVDGALTATGSGGTATLGGGLRLTEAALGAFALEFDAAVAEDARLQLRKLTLTQAEGARLDLAGEIDLGSPATPVATLDAHWRGLRWPLTGAAQVESHDGQARLDGTPDDYRLTATTRLRVSGVPDTDLRLGARGDLGAVDIEALDATAGAARARASGRLAWADGLELEVDGQWQALDVIVGSGRRLRSADGRFGFAGSPDAWRGEFDADLRVDDYPRGRARAQARGTRDDAEITAFALRAGGGVLSGRGSVDWSGDGEGPAPRWTAELGAEGFDPAIFARDWPGRIDFRAQTSGHPQAWTLAIDPLHGRLRGRPLDGEAALERAGETFEVKRLALRSGEATLTANGALGAGGRLDWRLDAPDLADLWPDARGRVDAQGSVAGPLAAPRLQGELHVAGLALDGNGLDALDAAWQLAPGAAGPQALSVGARGLDLGGHRAETLDLALDGPWRDHAIRVAARAGERRIEAGLRGGFDEAWRWDGRLESARAGDGSTDWTLRTPAPLTLAADRLAAGRQCWDGAGALCLHGERTADGAWRAGLELDALRLEALPRLGPWQQGALSGVLELAGDAAALSAANGRLRLPAAELPAFAEDWPAIAHDGLELELTTREDALVARAGLAVSRPSPVPVTVELALDEGPWRYADWRSWPIRGRLDARAETLAPWFATVEEITGLAGSARIDLAAAGPLATPDFAGTATLAVRHANLVPLGTRIEGLELALRSDDGHRLAIDGGLRAGPGRASLGGALSLADTGPALQLHLESESLQVVDLPEASALADAVLDLELSAAGARVVGRVDIPRGHFALSPGNPATTRSADVVVAGREAGESPASRLTADVRIGFGEEVTVAAQGFTGRLNGELRVTETPRQAARAAGEVRILDGRFSAYGQTLELRRARLTYTGQPLDDPAIDARAERVVGEVTAGLRVGGRLRDPRTTLYSTPALSDGEVLSYLLVGRPLSAAKSSDASALIGAAASLGIARGNLLSKGLARSFGLDELGVSGRPEDESLALSVGKYLSPRLYVGYGMGLFDRANTVRLRYLLNQRWSVEAETGNRTGADLLYSIEP